MQMVNAMRGAGAGVLVVSCSDPRINPYHILGIDTTLRKSLPLSCELHVQGAEANWSVGATMIRNAGGRVFDAIRTLAVLQNIGSPGTIVVIHHTGKSRI